MFTSSEPVARPEAEFGVAALPPAAPPAVVHEGRRQISWRPWLSTPALLGMSLLLFFAAIAAEALGATSRVPSLFGWAGIALFWLTTAVALVRAVYGLVALTRAAHAGTADHVGESIFVILGNLVMTGFGMLIAYISTVGFSRGRQLRRFGRVVLPSLRSSPDWTTPEMTLDAAGAPAGLADQWRENGKTEHASVAAFARLTLDLMALGAPPSLVAAANRDALDEIRHTELCFSIARSLDGKSVSPGPFPQAQRVATLPRSPTFALAKLAVDSLVDGALHEGVSARIIAKLAQRCEVTAIRAALKEIAADEGRHAAHGWAVVAWCLHEGGRPVGDALLGAIRTLPREMRSQLPAPAADGGWESWGIHGHRLESEEYAAALDHVVHRVQAGVAALSAPCARRASLWSTTMPSRPCWRRPHARSAMPPMRSAPPWTRRKTKLA